ncbi:MAG: hypothetical protein ACYDAJ_03055 [Nitrosotalea sp.]
MSNMQATAVWITGIPASDKTTISNLLKDYFPKKQSHHNLGL